MLDEFDITNLAHCDAVQGGGIHPISVDKKIGLAITGLVAGECRILR